MANGRHGTVDVTVGLSNGANGAREQAPMPHRRLRRSPREQERIANDLRARGWSYRRISVKLEISYGIVSGWLDGVGEPAPGSRGSLLSRVRMVPPSRHAPAGSPEEGARILQLVEENQRLTERVDVLETRQSEIESRVSRLDQRLAEAAKEIYRSLLDRLSGNASSAPGK